MPTRSCLLAPLPLTLCAISLTAQEYRYGMGEYVGAASYLGDTNRRIPSALIGGMGGVAFCYSYNFRLAFSGELGYSFLPFDCRYAQVDYPQAREANQVIRDISRLLALDGWARYNFAHYSDKFHCLQTRSLVPYTDAGPSVGTALSRHKMVFLPGAGIKTGIRYKLHNRLNLIAALQSIYYLSSHLDTSVEQTGWLNSPYRVSANWIKGDNVTTGLIVSITCKFSKRSELYHGLNSYPNWWIPK